MQRNRKYFDKKVKCSYTVIIHQLETQEHNLMEEQFKIGRGHILGVVPQIFLCSFEVDRKGKDMPKICDWGSDQ